MLSKNAVATSVDSILPTDILFTMFEKEYCLDGVELWDILKNCPKLSTEDKKTLLLLFFLTKTKNEDGQELEKKVMEIWEEIDTRIDLSYDKKTKTLCELVRELPEIWKDPYKNMMGSTGPTEEYSYNIKLGVDNTKSRCNERRGANVYRIHQSFSYAKVTSDLSRNPNGVFSLMIDTGASVSVIKADVVYPRIVLAMKQNIQFVGLIRHMLVESLGTCYIPLCYDDKKFLVKFHIISKTKNLDCDGVLGRNFFENHLVSIDYANRELLLNADDLKFPFFHQIPCHTDSCVIEGQSERMIEVMVKNTRLSRGYIAQSEITKGLLLCRGIAKVDKSDVVNAIIRNTEASERVIEPFYIELLPIPKFVEKDWPIMKAEMNTPAFREMEAQYKNFEECLNRSDDLPQVPVQEFNAGRHSPNALICSMNFDKVSFYSKIVNSVYKNNPVKPPGLYKLTKFVSERSTTYLCTDRYLYMEQPSSQDTFFTLYNLKKKLVSEKFTGEFFILELNRIRVETPRTKFFKMIHFIFQDTEIEPIVVLRRIRAPKTENEKLRAIYQNHVNWNNKHYGYVRTYNRVRDGYAWATIKEDIIEYMLKCSSCKYNLRKFRSLHRVLPIKSFGESHKPLQISTGQQTEEEGAQK